MKRKERKERDDHHHACRSYPPFTPLTDPNRDPGHHTTTEAGKDRQMSIHAIKSSANDLALPKTSTPAGHKRPAGPPRHSARPSKKRRVMQVQAVEEEPDFDSKSKRQGSSKGSSRFSLYAISDLLKSFSIGGSDSGPSTAAASSSSKPPARNYQPNHSLYEGASRTMDVTMEPEDDTLYPSPWTTPQGLPSTSSLNMDESAITRRREPMYNAEVSIRERYIIDDFT